MKFNKPVAIALNLALLTMSASAACCYFAALNKDVQQPGQRAFITWDEANKTEAFTVQPQFAGDAADFGMVIPTPSRPKLQEMPKDFFKALAVFTILEPMDMSKFPCRPSAPQAGGGIMYSKGSGHNSPPPVRVLEGGVVGNLDYKILEADKATTLFEWLKANHYHYGGDEATLNFYVQKKWNFTVMKVDPRQMKQKAGGRYQGEITPTRFTFKSPKAIYPLRITQISVKDQTDVLLYVMSNKKMDMDGAWSYEDNFVSMWTQAMTWANPKKTTEREKYWQKHLANYQSGGSSPRRRNAYRTVTGSNLEWSGKLTSSRLDVLTGKAKYNRVAPPEEIKRLSLLTGYLKQDWYLTKFRRTFVHNEMTQDISLIPARINGEADDIEYVSILPTSPP
jgi:hypothetical protein